MQSYDHRHHKKSAAPGPLFPSSRAFLVQFACDASDLNCHGRVEHVVTGLSGPFASPDDLFRFMRGVLTPATPTGSRGLE
ncbi:MAG TPA: hypothetical protein VEB21_02160 [Terriglobales bacterium]|nr:hypothetical protein [Terriglobales bacterium]